MSKPITRSLITGENLTHLREMDSESVDLVIMDPPIARDEKRRVISPALKDSEKINFNWSWKQNIDEETESWIRNDFPAVMSYLEVANETYGRGMGAFLGFQAARLIELRRIMKQEATICVECGSRGSHYTKQLMDAIFGHENFRVETFWKRQEIVIKKPSKNIITMHDSFLEYTKKQSPTISREFITKVSSFVWSGFASRIEHKGNASMDILSYPTQKPIALYEQMIKSYSKPNDLVLDPFAGTCSSLIAAEKLARQWIGIEICSGARDLLQSRLNNELGRNIPDIEYLPTPSQRAKPINTRNSKKLLKEKLLKSHGSECRGCGHKFPHPDHLEIDHIRPISDGGSDELENRMLLCHPCNQCKANRLTLSGLLENREKDGYMNSGFRKRYLEWRKSQKTPGSEVSF